MNENVDIGILIGVVGTNNRAGTVHWQIISQDVDLASPPQSGLDTFYYFNRAGFFIKKEPGGGPRGVWIDKCGNRCDYYFTFADPIVTPHTLTIDSIPDGELRFYPNTSEPMINKVMVMNKDMIYSHLAAGTAFEPHAFAPWALYSGSTGFEGPFDFSTKDFFLDRENYLFVTDDGENVVEHNYRNMGNFLWGAATRIMGVPEWLALTGAHLNNLFTDGGWDTNDDQWSIQLGRKYAKKMNWKTINGGRGNIFRN